MREPSGRLRAVFGVFGNISREDIERTIRYLPAMCAPDAWVLSDARAGRSSDVIEAIRGWFAESGFVNEALVVPEKVTFGVGAARLVGPPAVFRAGEKLFTFFR